MKSADQAASARGPHALLARLTGGPRPGAQPQGEMRGAESSRVRLQTIVALRWLAIIGQLIAVLVVALGFDFPLPLGTAPSKNLDDPSDIPGSSGNIPSVDGLKNATDFMKSANN